MTAEAPRRYVVSYFFRDEGRKATLHEEGCAVLARARLEQDQETFNKRYVKQLSVVEAERYERAIAAAVEQLPEPDLCRRCHDLGPRIEMEGVDAS